MVGARDTVVQRGQFDHSRAIGGHDQLRSDIHRSQKGLGLLIRRIQGQNLSKKHTLRLRERRRRTEDTGRGRTWDALMGNITLATGTLYKALGISCMYGVPFVSINTS